MKKGYIIGGGIAGLIFSYYNKGYTIIDKNVGGQIDKNFAVGPRYLHKNKYTAKFLSDLRIAQRTRRIKIIYVKDGTIIKDITDEDRERYYIKSRGAYNHEQLSKTILNCSQKEFDVFDIDWNKLIEKLTAKAKVLNEFVSEIDTKQHTFKTQDGIQHSYVNKKLISTIPLPMLMKLCNDENTEISSALNHIVCAVTKPIPKICRLLEENNADYIYELGSEKYYRVTKETWNNQEVLVFEFSERIDVPEYFGDYFINSKVLWGAKVTKNLSMKEYKNIRLLGRYSQVNHGIKTENIIEEAQKNALLN